VGSAAGGGGGRDPGSEDPDEGTDDAKVHEYVGSLLDQLPQRVTAEELAERNLDYWRQSYRSLDACGLGALERVQSGLRRGASDAAYRVARGILDEYAVRRLAQRMGFETAVPERRPILRFPGVLLTSDGGSGTYRRQSQALQDLNAANAAYWAGGRRS
jgi:hypothetical protein